MNSISHAKVSRIFKPVLVPSTVEGTRQEVEGIPSEQASIPLNHFYSSSSRNNQKITSTPFPINSALVSDQQCLIMQATQLTKLFTVLT